MRSGMFYTQKVTGSYLHKIARVFYFIFIFIFQRGACGGASQQAGTGASGLDIHGSGASSQWKGIYLAPQSSVKPINYFIAWFLSRIQNVLVPGTWQKTSVAEPVEPKVF